MKDSFSKAHPISCFAFFSAALLFTMFITQPVCTAVSLAFALANAVYFGGKKTVGFTLKFLLPAALLMIIINPLFNHRGATVLFYLPWDNPFTLESALYGVESAALICAAALWFSVLNKVMTGDKWIFLFGKAAPALSLLLSMSLRFIPLFLARFRQVWTAQKQIYFANGKSLSSRFRSGVRVFSIVVTWSLESAVETSDSMKSRGYGLKRRTAYSPFCFRRQNAVFLSAICVLSSLLAALAFSGQIKFSYFPFIKGQISGAFQFGFYIIYALLLAMPLIINIWEGIRWMLLRSKI